MSLKQQFANLGFTTNRQVAELLGVSAGTISVAFNGGSPATQQKMTSYLATAVTPVAIEPVAIEPAVTEPAVIEPAVIEPAVIEPAVIEPAVTEPAVTEPAVTEPAVTEPAVTEPATVATDNLAEYTAVFCRTQPISYYQAIQLIQILTQTTLAELHRLLNFWFVNLDGVIQVKRHPYKYACTSTELKLLLSICELRATKDFDNFKKDYSAGVDFFHAPDVHCINSD